MYWSDNNIEPSETFHGVEAHDFKIWLKGPIVGGGGWLYQLQNNILELHVVLAKKKLHLFENYMKKP